MQPIVAAAVASSHSQSADQAGLVDIIKDHLGTLPYMELMELVNGIVDGKRIRAGVSRERAEKQHRSVSNEEL